MCKKSFIKNLKEISKSDVSIAGGKGASLGEMKQAGISIPDGFVILSSVFDEFLKETSLNIEIKSILNNINIKNVDEIEKASKKIQKNILSKKLPLDIKKSILKNFKELNNPFVAVRSSATAEDSSFAAWAGQLDSFLNTTENTLLENVKRCWASLFTTRAIFYRFEKKLDKHHISVAVVVQEMIQSESSGIAFSVHPVTQDENQIIIEAGFGLGEAIVSGSITPDSYIIDKKKLKPLNINVNIQKKALYKKTNGGIKWENLDKKGIKQVLTINEILNLSKLIIKIENHYKSPCDIEWANENNKFYIVQSRPITTLNKIKTKNLTEYGNIPNIAKNDLIHFLERSEDCFPSSMIAGGFCNLKNAQDFFNINYTPSLVFKNHQIFSVKSKTINFSKEVFKKLNNPSFVSDIYNNNIKEGENLINILKQIKIKSERTEQSEELALLLLDFYKKTKKYCGYYMIAVFQSSITKSAEIISEKYSNNIYSKEYIFETITHPHNITEFDKEQDDLLQLAILYNSSINIEKELLNHIKKYTWLAFRYLRGTKWTINDLLDRIKKIKNPKQKLKERIDNRKLLLKKFDGLIKIFNSDDKRKATDIRKIVFLRTRRAEFLDQAFYEIMPFLYKISKKIEIKYDDMLFLSPHEVAKKLRIKKLDLSKKIKERKKINIVFFPEKGEAIILSGDIAKKYSNERAEMNTITTNSKNKEINGAIAFKGKVSGIAKIVKNENDLKNVKKGDILISIMTFPSFISAMENAIAFVTDEGGILCHAAIIAREMEKPCVISTKNATKIIKNGDLIEVDANQGIVRILKH